MNWRKGLKMAWQLLIILIGIGTVFMVLVFLEATFTRNANVYAHYASKFPDFLRIPYYRMVCQVDSFPLYSARPRRVALLDYIYEYEPEDFEYSLLLPLTNHRKYEEPIPQLAARSILRTNREELKAKLIKMYESDQYNEKYIRQYLDEITESSNLLRGAVSDPRAAKKK